MDEANNKRPELSALAETSGREEIDTKQEQFEGMLFESEEEAKAFYNDDARRVGFSTRILSSRKSDQDGSMISRGLGCRGGFDNRSKGQIDRREICQAMILLKRENLGKWVVRKFVREHNHDLVPQLPKFHRKFDKKIQELIAELRINKRLSTAYREQLFTFLKEVEDHYEHLSARVPISF